MSIGKQILIGGVLLLIAAAGGFAYHRMSVEGEAVAAVGRGPDAVPVEIATAAAGTMRDRIEAVGTTLARQAVDIVALSAGRVAEIDLQPGRQVEAGAVLIRLDDRMEQAAVSEAQAALREAQLALDRAHKLRTNNTVAQATVDELQAAFDGANARLAAAEKQLADRTVRAPFAGVVGMRRVDVGARVDNDTVLTTLDDLAELEIEFSVPEIYFGQLRPGQQVAATSAAFPGRTFEGRIATIDTRIGQGSRAFRVRAVMPNPDLVLPAGMFMHVTVVLEERPAVLIPEQAVLAEGDSTYVFKLRGERAERREVRLGQREAGTVEVLGGLAAGDVVVQSGLQRLRDGVAVSVRGRRCGGGSGDARGRPMSLSDFCIKRPVFAAVLSILIVVLGIASLLRLPIRELPDVDARDHQRQHGLHRRRARDRRHRHHRADRGRDRRHRRGQDHHLHEPARRRPHRDRVRAGPQDRRGRQRRARRRGQGALQAAGRGRRAADHQERQQFRPGDADRGHQRSDDPGRDHRLRRALHRRPDRDPGRRRPGPDLRRAALRDPHLARPAGDGGAQPHGRRRRERARAQQRRAAGRRAQVDAPPVHRALRHPALDARSSSRTSCSSGSTAIRSGSATSPRWCAGPRTTRRWSARTGTRRWASAVLRQSQANTIAISNRVRAQLDLIRPTLPDGMDIEIGSDDAVFINQSIHEVLRALGIAVVLVVLVIFAFLASARATLVPAVTIPVAVIGAFIGIYAFGFSINVLTLLALILAIGIVVDDAIVVLENIQRRIELGESPLVAGVLGARQVTFAVIATSLTLIAVFVPISFLEGRAGRLFTEFGFVLAVAVLISMVVALTLCPALCTKLLKGAEGRGAIGRLIERGLRLATRGYAALLRRALDAPVLVLLVATLVAGASWGLYRALPQELTPTEDRGVFFVPVTAPQGATVGYTDAEVRKVEAILQPLRASGEVARIFAIVGRSGQPHQAFVVARLAPWGDAHARPAGDPAAADPPALGAARGARRSRPVRPVSGSAAAGRRSSWWSAGPNYQDVKRWSQAIIERAEANPGLLNVESDFEQNQPQFDVADRPRQGGRPRHRRRDHRPDPADHARLARDHRLHRPRPRISGDRAGAGRGPADADRSRQHLRALDHQQRAGAAGGAGPSQ